jgi:two-component system chemotaxis response regulator CheB
MSSAAIRVLVVDDSAFTRKVLREILERQPGIQVVSVARDGLEGLEKVQELAPDVVTLDLVMPVLDGVGFLRELKGRADAPRVVIVSTSDADTERGAEALQLGAVDLVHKPTALATERLYELGTELVTKVRVAAAARVVVVPAAEVEAPPAPAPIAAALLDLVVVGTSTGGPQALTRLLAAIPQGFPAPIAVALHIPASYTEALARRLDAGSPLTVSEARDGQRLEPGCAYLCPGGQHLTFAREGARLVARLDRRPRGLYTPSVDALFTSAAEVVGARTLGVVLTGMGEDGLAGARAIKAAGGALVTESALSCVVHGMPRAVDEAGLSDHRAPLWRLPQELIRRVGAGTLAPPRPTLAPPER